ncbi:MAG: hypothetical protein J5685_10020, partial [Clostridiales bacterium]|nr:hypothetical protein [Clostridiales bacterium]
LSLPDSMMNIGGFGINVLPILMTLINVVSSIVYGKGKKFSEQWQTYLLAALFLILLYTSPSGLVLYWTCNNIFSLLKNVVTGIAASKKGQAASATVNKAGKVSRRRADVTDLMFILCGLFLSVFLGIYIPLTVIYSSPMEFIDLTNLTGSGGYIVTSFFIALGVCLFWAGIYYVVLGERYRKQIAYVMTFLSFSSAVNWFLFDKGTGNMSTVLRYDVAPEYSLTYSVVNLLAVIGTAAVTLILVKRYKKLVNYIIVAGIVTLSVISVLNGAFIGTYNYAALTGRDNEDEITWTLSTEGRNVVVIMLDRALSPVFPYILDEKPELIEQFDGFTYYPNTVSYGCYTNFAVPSLFGGYEYTPENMNARSDLTIGQKHNEAIKVLPVLFSENGFRSYFANPIYAGYCWVPDLSEFDDYPDITAFNTLSKLNTMRDSMTANQKEIRDRNFVLFSICRTAPVFLRSFIYDEGVYNAPVAVTTEAVTAPQNLLPGGLRATGYDLEFEDSFSVLRSLPEITELTDDTNGSLVILENDTTHEEMILQLPEYESALNVDNTEYYDLCIDRELNGRTMHFENIAVLMNYQVNVAALMKLGDWFDWMRENGVYDNTRIIIVSDHGRDLGMFDDMIFGDIDTMICNPLFLVKDFDSHGFTVSDEFMTNADTAFLACEGVIDDPVNPFTGNPITNDEKYEGDIHVFFDDDHDIIRNSGNTFFPGPWYSVHDNIFDEDNWEYLGEY